MKCHRSFPPFSVCYGILRHVGGGLMRCDRCQRTCHVGDHEDVIVKVDAAIHQTPAAVVSERVVGGVYSAGFWGRR